MARTVTHDVQTQIYAFKARKGGVTKSTLTANAGAALANLGYRVVMIESDGQGSLSKMCGVEPADSFYDLITGDLEWGDVLRSVPPKFAGENGELQILSSYDKQMLIAGQEGLGNIIMERFQELRGFADFVLIDTSPNIDEINNAWFYVADWLFLPTLCEKPSLDQLRDQTLVYVRQATEAAELANVPVAKVRGIIPNRYRTQRNVDRTNIHTLQRRHGNRYRIFPLIRDESIWATAAQLSMSIQTMLVHEDAYCRREARSAMQELLYVVDSMIEPVATAVL